MWDAGALLATRWKVYDYTFALVGNRLSMTTTIGASTSKTIYQYDRNDRLLIEQLDNGNNGSIEQTTLYYYGPNAAPEGLDGGDGTSLTKKEVYSGPTSASPKTSQMSYEYNDQGRLRQVGIDSNGDGTNERVEQYVYNDSGIRVQTTATEGQTVVTDYVIDASNPTGYAQVLEEWTAGATPNLARSFVIGHSILSQWTDQTSQVLFLLADGHGSTQMVIDSAGAIQQSYDYDAYGNLINPPASPLTSHLYTGEQFDTRTGQYYLRARYYNPAAGRFFQLDPYAGNASDPISLHKYLYSGAEPVLYCDPTGQCTFIDTLGALALRAIIFTAQYFPHIVTVTYYAGWTLIASLIAMEFERLGVIPDTPIPEMAAFISSIVFTAGLVLVSGLEVFRPQMNKVLTPLEGGKGRLTPGYNANADTLANQLPNSANTPPHKPFSLAAEGTMGQQKLVRLFSGSRPGGWATTYEEIRGLSPIQIQNKLALPQPPTHWCEVSATGQRVRISIANGIYGQDGRGVQVQFLDQLPENAFGPGKPLPPLFGQ